MNNEQIDRLTLESAITDVLIADEENKAKSTPSQMAGDIVDLYNIRIVICYLSFGFLTTSQWVRLLNL